MAEAEEHNDFMLERERAAAGWRECFSTASRQGIDPRRLEAICCQNFILGHGRHASQLRHLLRIRAPQVLRVATDLPPSLVDALRAEKHWQPERLTILPGL